MSADIDKQIEELQNKIKELEKEKEKKLEEESKQKEINTRIKNEKDGYRLLIKPNPLNFIEKMINIKYEEFIDDDYEDGNVHLWEALYYTFLHIQEKIDALEQKIEEKVDK